MARLIERDGPGVLLDVDLLAGGTILLLLGALIADFWKGRK